MLEAQPGWSVEAEAGDIDHALRTVLGHKPDILVLDLNLAGISSIEYIPELLERSPKTRIVVLTMQTEPPTRGTPYVPAPAPMYSKSPPRTSL